MKFIFDFDDVLFNNTELFKPYMYECFEKAGVPRNIAELYYKQVRTEKFWLKELLAHFSLNENLYEKILDPNIIINFLNKELISYVKKFGKENCYILTHGGEEFQLDKINKSGLAPLFNEIIVVFSKKTSEIERICKKYQNEVVLFIDDKQKHFEDLDLSKCPNLKTILYDEQGLDKFKVAILT